MEALKKKCMRQRIIVLIIMAIIGVLLLIVGGGTTNFAAFQALFPTELTADSDFEALEGKYVSYVMKAPLDYYETVGTHNYDTNKDTIKQYAYFVYDMDGKFFFGVMRNKSYADEMDEMIDQLWDYWFDDAEKAPGAVTIKGTLTKMDSQDSRYFDETIEYYAEYGITADAKYYYIEESRVDGEELSSTWAKLLIGLALILGGVFYYFWGKKSWDKKITKYLSRNSQYTRAQLEADIEGGKAMNGGSTIIGKRWLFTADSVINICALENLCWGYYYRRTGRYSVSQMRLFFTGGGMFTVNASEGEAKAMLQYLYEQLPYIVVGYDKEWEKLYNKKREEFLSLRYYAGKQQMKGQEQTGDSVAEEKMSYASTPEEERVDVELTEAGPNKIIVIKLIREATGLGLAETKEIVDNAPGLVKAGVSKAEAEEIKAKLEAEGARVTLK